jgi:hypothetical protein
VLGVQFAGWLLRFTAFWFLLEAFTSALGEERAAGPGREAVAAAVPFTAGGAGCSRRCS